MNYTSLAMGAAITVGVTAEAKHLVVDKKLAGKPVIAAFVLGVFLFIFGMASQPLASKFCYLIIITAVLVNGNQVFKILK